MWQRLKSQYSKDLEEEPTVLQVDSYATDEQSALAPTAIWTQEDAEESASPDVIQDAHEHRAHIRSRRSAEHTVKEPQKHKNNPTQTLQREARLIEAVDRRVSTEDLQTS